MSIDTEFYVDEPLSDKIRETMEERDQRLAASDETAPDGKAYLVVDLQSWEAGYTPTVAFLSGDTALHRDIEDATLQITDACNLRFDFGYDELTGRYRRWSRSDTEYQADIRVSFDLKGYSSLIGRDAVTPTIGGDDELMGGRAYQSTLNLSKFDTDALPRLFKGIVRHEFMHAVAFLHEHQNPEGGCDAQFRWADDAGYRPRTDSKGAYINDAQGRRPGVYHLLNGYPNKWCMPTTDHNLRSRSGPSIAAGPLDRESIMLYRFPKEFYTTWPNPCIATGAGLDLSDGDIAGLRLLYPFEEELVNAVNARRTGVKKTGIKEIPLR